MRRFTLVLLGCLALGSLPLVAVTRTQPQATALSAQPNIILIVTDDQTMDAMSALPELTPTPENGSWTTFNRAFINNPLCCPSRASILTGRFSHHTGVMSNEDAPNFNDGSTVATWLQAAGYRTGIVGKYFNNFPWDMRPWLRDPTYRPQGWTRLAVIGSVPKYVPRAQPECRGRDEPVGNPPSCPSYSDYILNESTGPTGPLTAVHYDGTKMPNTNGDYATDVLSQHAVNFIKNPSTKPFFLYFAPNAPHWPFWPSAAHINDNVTAADMPLLETRANFNKDIERGPYWERRRCQATPGQACPETTPAYDGTYDPAACPADPADQVHHDPTVQGQQCQHLNAWRTLKSVNDGLARMREKATEVGKWDNTVVIFMTDNGLSMVSHNWHAKSCIYEECIRTPLRIRYPGSANREVNAVVSNVDIAPTIIDIAGVTNQTMMFDGRSLKPWLQGSKPSDWRQATLIESTGWYTQVCTDPPPFYGVRSKHWVYAELRARECTNPPDMTGYKTNELYNISEPCPAPGQGNCVAVDPDQMRNRADNGKPTTIPYKRQQRLAACLNYLKTRAAVQWPAPPDEQVGPTGVCRDLTSP